MHAHMKNYVNMKHFMNHILIQSSPKHQNLQTMKKKMLKNQQLLNNEHVFFYTYSMAKPHDATPKKTGL